MIVQRTERLGMISVPWQEYISPLTPAEALCAGTVFSELNQPYTPLTCNQSPMQNMTPMSGMGMQKKR